MVPRFIFVISDSDPVAPRVAAEWGTPPAIGDRVDGVPLRDLGDGVLELRRPTLHVHDELLDQRLPSTIRESRPTLVFPSIHRSRENVVCLTVHPLGNLGPSADVGGRPRIVNPTDPRAMAAMLRRLSELAAPLGLEATYESTHHGPELGLPSFFAEIGFGSAPEPAALMVKVLGSALRELNRDSMDRVALAVGGGHYAPHFTELAVRRRWAFGHIISRHSLAVLDEVTAAATYAATPEVDGIVYARAADSNHPMLAHLGPRRRDTDAELRGMDVSIGRPTGDAPASGT